MPQKHLSKSKLLTVSILSVYLTIVMFLPFSILFSMIFAQEIDFQIDPMILEIEIKPGANIIYEYTAKGSKNTTYYLKAKPFVPKDRFGNLQTVEEETDFMSWIIYSPSTLTFTEDEQIIPFRMRVDIPVEAEMKDYYFVTTMTSKEIINEYTGNILSGEIQSPVLLTVDDIQQPGKREGVIDKFTTSLFHLQPSINFTLIVKNTGVMRFKSSGSLEIQNLFTQKKETENLLPQNILANSSRQILNTPQGNLNINPFISWYPSELVGIYKAIVNIKYPPEISLNELQLQSEPIYFIYFNPYLLTVLVIIILVIISGVVFYLRQSQKVNC